MKALAADLHAVLFRPAYPTSSMYRIARDEDGLQLDFLSVAHGVKSFEGLRKRAKVVHLGGSRLMVASLTDIIRSKKAAGRSRDLAVLEILESSVKKRKVTRKMKLDALKKESDLDLRDQIRRLLALPPERRTHFLRKRVGIRMSCL